MTKYSPSPVGHPAMYCINLRRREDRWQRMRAHLSEHGLGAKRFMAIDGATLDAVTIPVTVINREYDTTRNAKWDRHVAPNRRAILSSGELGCILSHLAVWDDMLSQEHRAAVVLEDDVNLVPGFKQKLAELLSQLANWDLLYLGYISTREEPRAIGAGLARPTHLFGSFGYAISGRGATRLLEALPVNEPLDNFLAEQFQHLAVYCAVPPLVVVTPESLSDSDIVRSAHLASAGEADS